MMIFAKHDDVSETFHLGSFSSFLTQIDRKMLNEQCPILQRLLEQVDDEDENRITGTEILLLSKELENILNSPISHLNSYTQDTFKHFIHYFHDKDVYQYDVFIT
ncbi:hypothetical protein [Alysiella crassa]|nr:hypothetical protein [Alysiella crassa]UOP07743.1 hypothetical protein LVJ80_05165 [Alysiella crassa]